MDCRVAQPPLLHVLSKFRTYFRTNSSPEGRGWPEGPGEGCKDSSLHPSPAASRHPLPSGEEFVLKHFLNLESTGWSGKYVAETFPDRMNPQCRSCCSSFYYCRSRKTRKTCRLLWKPRPALSSFNSTPTKHPNMSENSSSWRDRASTTERHFTP